MTVGYVCVGKCGRVQGHEVPLVDRLIHTGIYHGSGVTWSLIDGIAGDGTQKSAAALAVKSPLVIKSPTCIIESPVVIEYAFVVDARFIGYRAVVVEDSAVDEPGTHGT